MSGLTALRNQRGFTLVEVMVGVLILLVGVAGTAAMMNGANVTLSRTKGREGGTNVARSVIEVARSVPYRDMTDSSVLTALQSRPELADARTATAGHQIESRNILYAVSVSVCSMDDPKDRLGIHSSAVTYCSGNQEVDPSATERDRNPDDYRRVNVTASWQSALGHPESVTQSAVVTNPVGGLGPSVDLTMTSPLSNSITGTETTLASFTATTSSPAANVVWSIDGDPQGSANPDANRTTWTFNWPLLKADGTLAVFDGTYVVRATAYDDEGRSGTPGVLTVVVNRLAPLAPTKVEGGRNLNGNRVDVEWHANREADVVGYRVYRSATLGLLGTRVCPDSSSSATYTTATSCLDESAPAPSLLTSLWYTVVAVDKTSSGTLREGLPSTPALLIVENNNKPSTPGGLAACTGATPGCNGPDGTTAPSGTTVLTWNASTDPDLLDSVYFYRVYRDGTSYNSRYDRLYPSPGQPLVYVDSSLGGQSHTYRVTAVDKRFGESTQSSAVTR